MRVDVHEVLQRGGLGFFEILNLQLQPVLLLYQCVAFCLQLRQLRFDVGDHDRSVGFEVRLALTHR